MSERTESDVMACGHPRSLIVSSGEGTSFCEGCHRVQLALAANEWRDRGCGIADCDGDHAPQDHNTMIETELAEWKRVTTERDELRAELSASTALLENAIRDRTEIAQMALSVACDAMQMQGAHGEPDDVRARAQSLFDRAWSVTQ